MLVVTSRKSKTNYVSTCVISKLSNNLINFFLVEEENANLRAHIESISDNMPAFERFEKKFKIKNFSLRVTMEHLKDFCQEGNISSIVKMVDIYCKFLKILKSNKKLNISNNTQFFSYNARTAAEDVSEDTRIGSSKR